MSEAQKETAPRRTPLFIDPRATVSYVPRAYRDLPTAEQPVFTLRPLRHRTYEMRRDLANANPPAIGTWIILAVRDGLVSATGPDVPPVTFEDPAERTTVSDAYLDQMSPSLRAELCNAIETLTTLGPDALKG